LADVLANNLLKMKPKSVFSISKIRVKTNGYSYPQWKVEGRINGVRHRKFFPNKDLAEGHKSKMEVQAINEAQEVRATTSHLAADQLRDAEAALRRLNGQHSLVKAVDWFLQTYKDTLTSLTFAEVYPQFLEDRKPHLRQPTYDDYEDSFKSFAVAYGAKKLPDISTDDIAAFLRGRKVTGKTWNNLRADLSSFFSWAEKAPRKWITENPVADVEKFKVAQGLPEILTAKQTAELFAYLEKYQGSKHRPLPAGCLVPYFALATFAGIRPSINGGEITRIARLKDRSRVVDLKAGVIRITPDVAKTRDVRQITIQPNLARWLARYPLDRFPILPKNAFDLIHDVRTKFALGHDVLRHTFISAHVAKFRSMGDTALQAGNSEAMIKKHYLNLVSAEDAEAFWSIVPKR
jgi:integrase